MNELKEYAGSKLLNVDTYFSTYIGGSKARLKIIFTLEEKHFCNLYNEYTQTQLTIRRPVAYKNVTHASLS